MLEISWEDAAGKTMPADDIRRTFSVLGQKIEWMRANPLVCVEVDDINRQDDWASVIIFGRYEELPDTPQFEAERAYAHEMFSYHAMWWQPAYAATEHRGEAQDIQPQTCL